MPKTLSAAVAAAAVLAGTWLGQQAEAMMPAPAQTVGIAKADDALVQQVVTLCGMNGCAPVQTSRVRHHRRP